ncbi:hypothetical protein KPATCC21470_2521 [Kitasatospora purpeofusca]
MRTSWPSLGRVLAVGRTDADPPPGRVVASTGTTDSSDQELR